MKKVSQIVISLLLLLSCCISNVYADSKSTIVRYSVSAQVVYEDYDGSTTTQKVEVGSYLKEPKPLGKKNASFLGWVDKESNEYFDFSKPVTKHLTLVARYSDYTSIENARVILDNALIYNGRNQIQRVSKVLLDGKEIPLDALEISNNQGVNVGTYSMLIKAKEDSGYVGSLYWTWVIVPSNERQVKEDNNHDIIIGKGGFSVEVVVSNDGLKMNLDTDDVDLLNMLIEGNSITADELSLMAQGASLKFVVDVENDSAVTEESKELIKDKCKGYLIGQCFDISLYKRLYKNGKLISTNQIETTNDLLEIKIKLGDQLINKNNTIQRTYYVARNHKGQVDLLDTTYNDKDKTITFKTNRFSDYAIVYKDKKIEKKTSNTLLPHTGDYTNISMMVIMLIGSFIIIMVIILKRKKSS